MIRYGSLPLYNPDKVIAISDVHGEIDKLKSLWEKIIPYMTPNTHIVFLGDLINRGKNSVAVLEFVTELRKKYPDQIFNIEGNHEWMLKAYCLNHNKEWMSKGGQEKTLYQMKTIWNLDGNDPEYILEALEEKGIWEWFNKLLPYYETNDLICVHAPLERVVLSLNGAEDYEEYLQEVEGEPRYLLDRFLYELKWRFADENYDLKDLVKKFWICGHQYSHHSQPRIFKNRAYIDTGCGEPNRPLTALVYPGKIKIQSEK